MIKPKTINSDLTRLPSALTPLTSLNHWLLWRWEIERGKWTKPPYSAADLGTKAKTDDPRTWSSYLAAIAAARTVNADGIGFVLRDTLFDVVDLDHCVDAETGEIDAWAQIWLEMVNGAYIERTPSGEGLRIIGAVNAAAKLHRRWRVQDAREKAGIEIYRNCERYITVTGAQLGDCQQLTQIDLLDRIKAHYDGGKTNGAKRNNDSSGGFDFNKAGKADSKSIDYDEIIRTGAPEGQRSELFQACVWHLAAKHRSIDEIVAELAQYPNGIAYKYAADKRLRAEVERSYEKWRNSRSTTTDKTNQQEPEEPSIWDTTDKNGIPRPTRTNARRALRALDIKCRYDEFHDTLLVEGNTAQNRLTNIDHTALRLSLKIQKAFGFDPGPRYTLEAIIQIALENRFDPVADYLGGLQWDGTARLDRWMIDYLGAEDTELNRAFGRIALIAAVRRVRRPGCKFDPIVVLEGPMGTQKSKAIETLAGTENFSDQTILGARDREQQELLAGVWLFEIAELSGIRRTEVEHIKAFASRTHDRARPAYGRSRVDQPRRCVLFATTNDDQYLKAADRRFWPVKTGQINIDALKRDRDQLWAEAAQQEREGASLVLDWKLWATAHAEQEAREEADPWDDILIEVAGNQEQGEERAFSRDLLTTVLGIHPSKQRDIDNKRLARCMRRVGWSGPKTIRVGDKNAKGFSRSCQLKL
jgi:hypothetical protein